MGSVLPEGDGMSEQQLLARVKELESALEPFVDLSSFDPDKKKRLPEEVSPGYDDLTCVWLCAGKPNGGDYGHLRVEDFRRARSVYMNVNRLKG